MIGALVQSNKFIISVVSIENKDHSLRIGRGIETGAISVRSRQIRAVRTVAYRLLLK
jgi:hypothetical protein